MSKAVSFNKFTNSPKGTTQAIDNKHVIQDKLPSVALSTESDTVELSDSLEKAKRQNGLIEKLADKIKALTGFGISSKKIQSKIDNKAKSEEIKDDIKNYRKGQENIAQTVGDVASGLGALAVFFKGKQSIQTLIGKYYRLNEDGLTKIVNFLGSSKFGKYSKNIESILKSKKTPIIIGLIGAAQTGEFIKTTLLQLNRIGTEQYSPKIDKKTMSKEEIKKAKKESRKEKRHANLRNHISGFINGLTVPIIMLGGGFGAVLYIGINSLNKYFIGCRENKKEKSMQNYINDLKNSPITNAAGGIALLIPAFKSGRADKIFNNNLEKTIDKIKKATLENKYSSVSTFEKLNEILFKGTKISEIINNSNLTIRQKIQMLSDENIFALKFKQITSNADELAKALKTDCPPTMTVEEANNVIKKTFGNRYEATRCVGVGTVAETYLAKDSQTGKEVCIKMLKKGITLDKIEKDEKAFIEAINNLTDKTAEEKEFLITNFKNIASGVKAEVNFNNEANAAKTLKKATHQANVVVPIDVKDSIYVMEKANGVSLQKLMEYLNGTDSIKYEIEFYTKKLNEVEDEWAKKYYERALQEAKNKLAEFEEKTKDCKEIGQITKTEARKLLEKYQEVLLEQFSKINEKGKIIHGDIHPGNIFVDIPAMRKGDKNVFTLIDTGNTIQQDQQTALRFLNLSNYIKNADTENLTNFVLTGAKLPNGMTKEQAFNSINEELKTAFFDDKTKLGIVTNDSLLVITDSIMQKLNIIPADTQGNLMKAKISANQSLLEFMKTFFRLLGKQSEENLEKKGIDIENIEKANKKANKKEQLLIAAEEAKMITDIGDLILKYKAKTSYQEWKNLQGMSPTLRASLKKSKSTPAKNSEEYLTYILKQHKKDDNTSLFENLLNFSHNNFA